MVGCEKLEIVAGEGVDAASISTPAYGNGVGAGDIISMCSLQSATPQVHCSVPVCPLLPPDQPQKFAHVHKVFGVANVTKMLHELPPTHREDCVNSLAYEADARVQDPVYGCVGSISVLQQQAQLALATSEITRLRETFAIAVAASTSTNNDAAPGALLVAALLPCSPTTQADSTSSPEVNPAATPQRQQPSTWIMSRKPHSPTSCEHSPPQILL